MPCSCFAIYPNALKPATSTYGRASKLAKHWCFSLRARWDSLISNVLKYRTPQTNHQSGYSTIRWNTGTTSGWLFLGSSFQFGHKEISCMNVRPCQSFKSGLKEEIRAGAKERIIQGGKTFETAIGEHRNLPLLRDANTAIKD